VIADVHGNLQALEAVLRALDAQAIPDILCLGDLVGYNADSDACVGLLHERRAVSIAGNHDLIALGQLGFEFCAPNPEFSLRRTRRRLSAGTRGLLRTLPRSLLSADGVTLIHGALDDPTHYLHTARDVAGEADPLRQRWPAARLCFFGHTHVPALYQLRGASREAQAGFARRSLFAGGAGPFEGPAFDVRHLAPLPEQQLDGDAFWFVNPGSVDAARRGDGLAQYAVFDSGSFSLSLHRVPYDHARAEASAVAGGYRMDQVQRRLLSARRLLRRVRRKAVKTIRSAVGGRSAAG
jgi:predicted phosphodiesterase